MKSTITLECLFESADCEYCEYLHCFRSSYFSIGPDDDECLLPADKLPCEGLLKALEEAMENENQIGDGSLWNRETLTELQCIHDLAVFGLDHLQYFPFGSHAFWYIPDASNAKPIGYNGTLEIYNEWFAEGRSSRK